VIRNTVFAVFLVFALGCAQMPDQGPPGQPQTAAIPWQHDLAQAKELAKAESKPLLLDFYTDWCGWCKRMDKDTYANKKVIDYAENFICVKINADEQRQLTKEYNVRGFPSTVFLRSDGEVIESIPGYMPPEAFLKLMQRILSAISAE
jgi:thioredoxin-related protein